MDQSNTHGGAASPRRRRILVLIKCMGHGGAEQLVVSMMRRRDRERFDYEVAYILEDRDTLVPQLREAGVAVHSLGSRGNQDLRWIPRLRGLLVEGDFDIVHSHLPYAATFGRLVAATLPPPRPALVYTEHCMWDTMALPVKVLNRPTIRLDDRFLVVSEACRQSLPPALRRRAQVLVHGIELEPIRDAALRRSELRKSVRDELDLSDGELLALTVANFRWQKGYDVLLSAAKQVTDRCVPVRFAAVGDGPLRPDLERRHVELSLHDHFVFLGERDDVPRLLAAADMFVLPSRYEGLPLALMEAVCSGLPVVATAVSEIPNLLTNGSDALLVPPEEPGALAEAITEMARDAALRRRLAAAALRLADRFDIERCVREVESIYDQLQPQPAPLTQ